MNADIARLRQQLRQLQSLHEEGALGAAAYERSRGELERKLIDAVMRDGHDASPAVGGPAGPSRTLLAGMVVAVLAVAAAGYWWTRTPATAAAVPIASQRQASAPDAPASAPHALSFKQIEDMADKLAQRLKAEPKDPEGWAMLARSYTMLGRRAEAVTAYERAVALQGGDASLLADYADALAVTRESRLAGEPAALVERALKLDPNHAKALSLAGTAAFERKDYAGAVARWEHLLEVAPPDSPFVEPMRANIAQARELGGLAATSAPASASGPGKLAAAGGSSVSGTVRLAAAAAAKASPEDTVFVFARAAEGSRMPLAILRKQVKDLPLDFRLDDSMAMSPSTKLSSAAKVVVGARLSKSGDAMPQPGDWTGQSAAVSLGATGLRIEISKPAGQ